MVSDEEGAELRTEALRIVESTAETLDADLRASFVDRPDVRALVGSGSAAER